MPAIINGVEQTDPVGTWPEAAAPDDGVSLPAAVAYLVERQIGTIDNTTGVPTLGGVLGDMGNQSIAMRLEAIEETTEEIEHHFHTRARWFGKKAVQTATVWADNATLALYRAISGNNTYGADANDEALVFGKGDTVISGQTKFDMDKVYVAASSATTVYKLRFVYGRGTMAEAIAAGQFTETVAVVASASSRLTKEDIRMPRLDIGYDQVWCQAWNATDNATIDFLVGIHGYDS